MNTAYSPCATRPLTPLAMPSAIRTWTAAARAWWARGKTPNQAQQTESQLTALDGLTAETLKDIGAPEWLYERAHRTQERARQGGLFERDSMHWR
ncbi:MAG TPA: hypothetical protein VIM63_12160 [Rhodoferax sp.]